MLNYFQAFILGGLQGMTELFPVSSLGHSVILPKLLGWDIAQGDDAFLVFLVATHFATALVLIGFFFKDWLLITGGIMRSLKTGRINTNDTYAKLGWLLIIATIPAGLLGLLLEKKLKLLFAVPLYASLFLFANGIMLYGAEKLRKAKQKESVDDTHLAKLPFLKGLWIGCAQCIALLPGFSRTGATLGGGLLAGFGHEDAARFSFLMATPIITLAALHKLPELIHGTASDMLGQTLFGSLVSGIAAYLSVRFLTKYFKTNTLTPFAIYCLVVGGISFVIFNF